MTLRVATADDAEAVVAIYAPIVTATSISFEWDPPTPAEMRARIETTLATHPWLVALDDTGAVVGYVYAAKHRDAPSYQWSVNTSAYIRADSRRLGIGKRLYAALFDRLAGLGYFRAYAGIALPNEASVALHESVGFAPLGVYERVGFKHGAWHDVGWWQRCLKEGVPKAPPRAFRGGEPESRHWCPPRLARRTTSAASSPRIWATNVSFRRFNRGSPNGLSAASGSLCARSNSTSSRAAAIATLSAEQINVRDRSDPVHGRYSHR
jgi:phosphinothricin acetyltransferase